MSPQRPCEVPKQAEADGSPWGAFHSHHQFRISWHRLSFPPPPEVVPGLVGPVCSGSGGARVPSLDRGGRLLLPLRHTHRLPT